jgi:two-component system, OmpR family, response regulator
MVPDESAASEPETDRKRMETPATPSGRILVVDDEPLVCDSFKRMLVYCGHEVETVGSGAEALALLEQEKFDLIVIDYAMPGMKGDELAGRIKTRMTNQPIIMITASAEMLQSSGNPLLGVDCVLGKPFPLEQLRDSVAAILQKKHPAG